MGALELLHALVLMGMGTGVHREMATCLWCVNSCT